MKRTGEAMLLRLSMPLYYMTRVLNTTKTNLPMAFKLLYRSPTCEIAMQV